MRTTTELEARARTRGGREQQCEWMRELPEWIVGPRAACRPPELVAAVGNEPAFGLAL